MKLRAILIYVLVGLFILNGCSAPTAAPPTTAPSLTVSPSSTPSPVQPTTTPPPPTSTPTLVPTSTLAPTSTPPPTQTAVELAPPANSTPDPLTGKVTSGQVNLREGPGKLFPILKSLPYNSPLEVFGAAPGREWLQIRTAEGDSGWVKAEFVKLAAAPESLDVLPVSPDWITIKGSVKDSTGKPVFGAYLVLYDGKNHGTDAKSWEDGRYFLFLPKASAGSWYLAVVGVDCINYVTNPVCHKPGVFVDNPRQEEVKGDLSVDFVYRY